MTIKRPFQLSISLNVLEHLGINLYSNVAAVLSETVANSWDADASAVSIDIDRDAGRIVIQDDGTGMTRDEVNDRFLTVGYRRRDEQPGLTRRQRAPMGRKGIGKLSLFSIAGNVKVETANNGERSALLMKLDDIRQKIVEQGGQRGVYEPKELATDGIDFTKGTRITLEDLRKRQTLASSAALRRRLARRFSIVGTAHNFKIILEGQEVAPGDRDYYDKIQYLWTYGDQRDVVDACFNADKTESRSRAVARKKPAIAGWLATVRKVGSLKDEDGENLNRIAIFVRGRIAQENLLDDFSERGVYASYLVGELRVDDLDVYDGEGTVEDADAATSSRQKLVEDDPRYLELKDVLRSELKHIESSWSKWREEDGAKQALEIPGITKWIDGMKPALQSKAKRWLGRLNRLRVDNADEQKRLVKHAVLAFEFYRANENLERLDTIDDNNIEGALEIFRELDHLEANLYGQIVEGRIRVIRTLREKVDANAKEKVIQEYVFDHLWLLDPSWERVDSEELMEKRVDKLFKEVAKTLTAEERSARIDIKYRQSAGKHIIVELKRPDRTVSVFDLAKQVEKYRSGIQKILDAQDRTNEPIDFVCLLGKRPLEAENPRGKKVVDENLKSVGARVKLYDELLNEAYRAYDDYLKRRTDVDTLAQLFKEIDDYAPDADGE